MIGRVLPPGEASGRRWIPARGGAWRPRPIRGGERPATPGRSHGVLPAERGIPLAVWGERGMSSVVW